MQSLRLILLASGLAVLIPVTGYAQSLAEIQELSREDRRAYMESMSPDERVAMREQWHREFDAMSDEEHEAIRARRAANRPDGATGRRKENRAERRERWESMSDEERAAMREQRGRTRAERRERWESMSDEERAALREKRRDRGKGRGYPRRSEGVSEN